MKRTLMTLALCSMAWAQPESLSGTVVRVIDGDTVRVRLPEGEESVRMDSIDAPERRQAGGQDSRRALTRTLPKGTRLHISSPGRDRYQRILGQIYLPDGTNVNVLQVSHGQAWVYLKYCRDLPFWAPLQARAQTQHLGLWAVPNPVPPWDYRHPRR